MEFNRWYSVKNLSSCAATYKLLWDHLKFYKNCQLLWIWNISLSDVPVLKCPLFFKITESNKNLVSSKKVLNTNGKICWSRRRGAWEEEWKSSASIPRHAGLSRFNMLLFCQTFKTAETSNLHKNRLKRGNFIRK